MPIPTVVNPQITDALTFFKCDECITPNVTKYLITQQAQMINKLLMDCKFNQLASSHTKGTVKIEEDISNDNTSKSIEIDIKTNTIVYKPDCYFNKVMMYIHLLDTLDDDLSQTKVIMAQNFANKLNQVQLP